MFNTAPIFTLFFGALFLKEKVGFVDAVVVIMGFFAAGTIIFGIFIGRY